MAAPRLLVSLSSLFRAIGLPEPQVSSIHQNAATAGTMGVSGVAAKGVASASAQGFLDPGSNVGVLYYSDAPMTAGFHVVVVRGAGS
jgi:hypothetical protein